MTTDAGRGSAERPNGGSTADLLRSFCQELEDLARAKADIGEQMKTVLDRAKASGFAPGMVKLMVKERAMGNGERYEYVALGEIYRAALFGMPLGELGRERLGGRRRPPPGNPDEPALPFPKTPPAPPPAADPAASEPRADAAGGSADWTDDDDGDAAAKGEAAGKAGEPITGNPYPAGDDRRALWDIAWCKATGSDGMDIPAAWRRTEPKKSKKDGDAPSERNED